MGRRPSAPRLTWYPELQLPFESGWSVFHKLKVFNNLRDSELADLVAKKPVPYRKGRLRDCADSSWIDFDRFSELLDVPARNLKTGFWDQLGIEVLRPKEYQLRLCKMCWDLHCYHCVLFDLVWVRGCPWHGWPVDLPKSICVTEVRSVLGYGEPPAAAFENLLFLQHLNTRDRDCLAGHVVEYLEWWRAVQTRVPNADRLLRRLVSTSHLADKNEVELRWQAGFAQSHVQPRYGSWILEDVVAKPCSYTCVTDVGRSAANLSTDRNTIRDLTGVSYRAIRRHVFRRYVRRHRTCLARLSRLSRDDLLSFVADGVCATCLAYVIWRMSVEGLVVMEGLFTRRDKDYELRLVEPCSGDPSDDPTRLKFTFMQFFGIWAAIIDRIGLGGLKVSMQETVSSPQIVFAKDTTRPPDSPLRVIHCIYPSGDALLAEAGRPCNATWKLLPREQQCAMRSQAWLNSVTPEPRSIFEIYFEGSLAAAETSSRLWV